MNRKKWIGIGAIALAAAILIGFGVYKMFFAPKGYTKNLTDAPLSAAVVADYTKTEAERTETFASGSKGYSWENGDPFNVWWKAENAVYDGGKLTLKLSEMTQKEQVWNADGTASDCLAEYYGSEVRSEHYYGYGDFQVRMKPAAISGTASTFFTCTGPYDVWYNADGTVARQNDHDEIDIEFLGKDTTKVQFNYFASGKGGHEYMYSLGFDASKEFHNYGYRWTEESITWFVDDKPVYKVLRSEIPAGEDWPEDPGRIVMNYWCGTSNAALWMGRFKDDFTAGAEYEWIASSAQPQPDPASTMPGTPVQDGQQSAGQDEQTALDLSAFDGWGKYTVVNNGSSVTISHDKKVAMYDCCGMDLALGERNKVTYTVTNDGTEKAYAKVSVKSSATDKSAIVSATINGVDAGYYEYGVLCELEPGQSADVAMLLDMSQKPSQMVVSLNSEGDAEGKALRSDMPKTGKITLSNLKAEKSTETALPGAGASAMDESVPASGPMAPEGPLTEWAALDLSAFDGWGKYNVTKAGDKVTISHDRKLQKYDCCGTELALGGRNKVSYTVTNTGTEKAFAKVSIKNTSGDKSAITSATINGADAGYYEYGVLCELAPGQSADVVMLLDLGQKPSQMVVSLNSEADSAGKAIRSDMPKTGSVVISNLKAVKSNETALPGTSSKPQPSQSQQEPPKAPEGPVTELAALDLSAFDGWGKYTVSKADGAITVSHNKTVAMYDCCGVDIALGERNKVQFTLTNNGSEKAFAKVNVKDRADSTGVSSIKAATVNGVAVDYVQYGVLCELAPGKSADVEIYVDGGKPADQLVLSLNSEGDAEGKALRSDMPKTGKVTLSNVQAVKAVIPAAPEQPQQTGQDQQPPQQSTVPDTQWADVDLSNLDGWGKYTVAKTPGAVTVSHSKAAAMYDCCGGEIALGSRNKVKLTLTNNGTEKAYAKVNINDKTITTGISSIQAATINGADAGYIEYGVLCELPAGESAQVELLLAPGKAADQLVISLNSEGDAEGKALRSDMPKTGKVTLSNLQAVKTDETTLAGAEPAKTPAVDVPLDQWLDVDLSAFDGWGMYTVEKADGSVTMSHDKAVKQYACAGMNYEPGERNKVKMTITNHGSNTAEAKVSIKSDKVDTSAILGATIDGKAVNDATYGVMCKVPAGKSVELVVFLDLNKDISQFVVSLNSEKAYGSPTAGNITISEVQAIQTNEQFTKASGSGGGNRGGGGSSSSPAPAIPALDGTLTLPPSAGTAWHSTTTAASAEGGGVTLSHSSPQTVYGNYSWLIGMGGKNKMELDITNNADVKAYAKVSLTTQGDNTGVSVLESATVAKTPATPTFRSWLASPMSALLRSNGAVPVDYVQYGVMCELEPGESAHVVMIVKPEKLSQANKLVVSLNSEGIEKEDGSTVLDPNMPATGRITLKNIMIGEAETVEPDPGFTDPTTPWELALEDWSKGKYTLTNAAGTVQLSHASAVDSWTCVGKAGLDFGDAKSLMFTVTNNAAAQAKLQFNVVHKEGDAEAKAATAATVTVDGVAETLDVSDGVIFTLDGNKSAVVRITLDPAKNANQIVVFLNSMQPAGTTELAQAGDVTISEAKWDKENDTPVDPDPGEEDVPVPTPVHEAAGEGWTDISLAGAWSSGNEGAKAYVLTPSEDNMALTVSHQEKVDQDSCAGTGIDLKGSKEVKIKIKNNADAVAYVKVNVRVNSGDSTSIVSAKINGAAFEVDPAAAWGVLHQLAANGEAEFLLTLDENETPDALSISLNSNGGDMPAKGSVSIVTAAYKAPGGDEPGPDTPEIPEIPDGWDALDVSGFDGWGKYIVNKPDGKVNITHAAAVETNGCCGANITWNGGTQARIIVKNNLTDKAAYVKISLQNSGGVGVLASAKVQENALSDVTWGALGVIPAGESYVYDLTVQDGETPAKIVVSFNSEGNETMPEEGDITIVQAAYEKAAGGDEPEDDGLTDMDLTTFTGVWGYTVNGLNISYNDGARSQWMNAKEMVDLGNATTLKLAIKNNHASNDAIVKVKLEKAIDDNNGTANITSGKITVDGTEISSDDVTVDDGLKYTIPAGKTAVYEITVDEGAVDRLVIFLNSLEDPNTIAEGNITITSARWNKTGDAATVSLSDEIALFSALDEEEAPAAESPELPPAAPAAERPETEAPAQEDEKKESVDGEDRKEPEKVLAEPVLDSQEELPDEPDSQEQTESPDEPDLNENQ